MQVAIIGAGPSGSALAIFLAQKGISCLIFDNEKRPELLVGESLVPAAIPYLQRMGVEKEVAAVSLIKKGAALRHPSGRRVDFIFRSNNKKAPDYAYNIPRPQFDDILIRRAKSLGVQCVKGTAEIEKSSDSSKDLVLTKKTLALAGLFEQPDLLVDATGRSRLFSRVLGLSSQKGGRDDVAYFAHFDDFKSDSHVEGQVVLSVIDPGWSWQIPLKNCLSVGVVVDRKKASSYGASAEQRLDSIIEENNFLRKNGKNRKRISKVKSYSNYQLISKKTFGKGWALLGDAFGFVDPMLSPGVFMALESAALFEKNVFSKNNKNHFSGLQKYSNEVHLWLSAWNNIINYFYDGRLLALSEAGQNVKDNASQWAFTRVMEAHIQKVITGMVSGVATRSSYNQKALFYSCRHLLSHNVGPNDYAIKSNIESIFSERNVNLNEPFQVRANAK